MGSAPFWGQTLDPSAPDNSGVVDCDGLRPGALMVPWVKVHDIMYFAFDTTQTTTSTVNNFAGSQQTPGQQGPPPPTSTTTTRTTTVQRGTNFKQLPGIVKITGSRMHKVHKKSPAGKSGGTLTYLGREIPEFDIVLTMWRQKQWEIWQSDFIDKLLPENDDTPPNPVEVRHPFLNAWRIDRLSPMEIGLPIFRSPPHQEYVDIRMRFVKFYPPQATTVTHTPNKAPLTFSPYVNAPSESQSNIATPWKPWSVDELGTPNAGG